MQLVQDSNPFIAQWEPDSVPNSHLLNALALVLVGAAKSDVVAVAVENLGRAPFRVFYARNWPCTTAEVNYTHNLISVIQNLRGNDIDTIRTMLSSLVHVWCAPKIRSRMNTILSHLRTEYGCGYSGTSEDWKPAIEGFTVSAQVDNKLREIIGTWLPQKATLQHALKLFFDQLAITKAQGLPNLTDWFCDLSAFAYALVSYI